LPAAARRVFVVGGGTAAPTAYDRRQRATDNPAAFGGVTWQEMLC